VTRAIHMRESYSSLIQLGVSPYILAFLASQLVMDAPNFVLSTVGLGLITALIILKLYNNAYTIDVLELMNESDSLQRAVMDVTLHSNYEHADQDVRSLVQQGFDTWKEAASLLRKTPFRGTSAVVRISLRAKIQRWNQRKRTMISKMRMVKSMLMHIVEDLYVMPSSLGHTSITDTLQRAEGRPEREGEWRKHISTSGNRRHRCLFIKPYQWILSISENSH
jgi:hypothetical protein